MSIKIWKKLAATVKLWTAVILLIFLSLILQSWDLLHMKKVGITLIWIVIGLIITFGLWLDVILKPRFNK
ncbi:MAG: hypothetical protein V1837_06675 [Candidatus Woesearchaeota archaeon]